MNAKELFDTLMEDLRQLAGLTYLRPEGVDGWIVPLMDGTVEVNVKYGEATEQVLVCAEVGAFEPSIDNETRARALLEMNWQWKESRGFTIGVDDESSRLIIADRRAARRFASADALGAYLASAAELVLELRENLAEFEDAALCLAEEDIAVEMNEEEKEG